MAKIFAATRHALDIVAHHLMARLMQEEEKP